MTKQSLEKVREIYKDNSDDELNEQIRELQHAVQSGISLVKQYGLNSECEPKHLRVGVNSTFVTMGALVSLLIEKGIITRREMHEFEIILWTNEVARYEDALFTRLGQKVSLV
jgi:hypothetical protein